MSAEQSGVAAAEFAELPRAQQGGAGQLNLDLIMDVRLMLTLEVGRGHAALLSAHRWFSSDF